MRCGPGSSRCCPIARRGAVGGGVSIVRWSRRSAGDSGRARRGGTCRPISLPGRRSGGVSTGGPRTAPGTGCSSSCRVRPTRSRIWSGWSRSTPPLLGRISMPPAHASPSQGARSNHRSQRPEPEDHALGRSRGGWSTKTHLSVDRRGRPLSVRLTPGQAGDNPQLLPLIDEIRVPAAGAGGRPRRRPDWVIADKAYSHPSTRRALRRRGIRVVIPEKSDQTAHRTSKGSRGGRPPRFDAELYRDRNVVERAFNRLKGWRGIATRYDKHARNYRAGVILACIVLFWAPKRPDPSDRP